MSTPPIDITMSGERLRALDAVATRDRRSLIVLTVTAITLIVLLVFVATRTVVQPPALSFRPITYAQQEICPGDPIEFDILLTPLRAPVNVTFPYSVWDASSGATISSGVEYLSPIYLAQDIGREITVTQSFVDTNLLPGQYEYRRIVRADANTATFFAVPFRVRDCQ